MTNPHPEPAVVIRERTPADLPGAAAALLDVHRTDGYPVEGVDDPTGWLTNSQQLRAWVADRDGQIVGHVAIGAPQPDDAAAAMWKANPDYNGEDVAVLGRLFVVSTARGHALAKRLMAAATEYAQQHGLRLVLDVMTKDHTAITLYERLGWQRIGTADHDNGKGQTVPAYCYVSPHPRSTTPA
ncbi:GNAT family N-acetyltransferase [Pseudonocardia acidicola]|uniref:GNAT family N-acetyltransferase n=1 Tax=Pseudonocardia acidicola TaxID=2724939 RepID=A0ABX1SJ50_9PSEU|nr:GNAT family N-acetyltransferase [Pseudonocardia acidicola]NMI00863.1 GNAT family N-acetyltransferase [Pseudonocardia acidicola]